MHQTFGPVFFAQAGIAPVGQDEAFGCSCAICGRKVFAPHVFQKQVVWCLYCGIDRKRVPVVEIPCGATRYSYGITLAECDIIERKLSSGDPEELGLLFERWAKVNSKILCGL